MIDWFVTLIAFAIIWAVFILYGNSTFVIMLFTSVLLLAKAFALGSGILWLYRFGADRLPQLRTLDNALPADANRETRRGVVLGVLSETPCGVSPAGVLDCSWWQAIDFLRTSADPSRRLAGHLLYWLRLITFRFEGLILLGALLLLSRPYGPPNVADSIVVVSSILSAMIAIDIFMMTGEVLVGNVILGGGYSRYFHLRIADGPMTLGDRRDRLKELFNFGRLVVCSLIAIAAIFQSHSEVWQGFSGTKAVGAEQIGLDGAIARLCSFVEFLSFVCTTFATVGYGDIYPNHTATRLMVIGVHILTMVIVLVLLQVVLVGEVSQEDE